MRTLVLLSLTLLLGGCELIYKLPTRQGNVIEQKQLDQLQTGMTKDQIRFLLGTPLAASPFRNDRWDYVWYYRSPRGKVASRTVSLYFDADSKLARMEGEKLAGADATLDAPDIDAVLKAEKKAKLEDERSASEDAAHQRPRDPSQPDPAQLPNP